jgi:tripartite-type tricarboxylate transporter receptor subunit TctC
MRTRRMFLASFVFAAALGNVGIAAEPVYPSRPITIVVPFAAGGPSDTIARIMAEHMRVSLGQPIILENVAGAAGSVGTNRVARVAGDGYTLVIGVWGTHVLNGAIYALRYDLLMDFEPISLLASNPMVIVAKKTMPAKDLTELIAWLKANRTRHPQGPPVPAAHRMSPQSSSRRKRARDFNSCLIAVSLPRCRIWWPVRLT